MSQLSYTLLVGAIAIILGVVLCLAILNAMGQLNFGNLFRKQQDGEYG